MTDSMAYKEAFEKVFQQLTAWRNLPKYQLERRADIFFSLYLKEILEERFGKTAQMLELVIPEFPLRVASIKGEDNNHDNHTVNVDFVMFSEETVFLIELKTDSGSSRDVQNQYLSNGYERIIKHGFTSILEDLFKVFKATNAKQKYYHLLSKLEGCNLIALPKEIDELMYADNRQGLSKVLVELNKNSRNYIAPRSNKLRKAQVVFIQPEDFTAGQKAVLPGGSECINFTSVAKVLEGLDPFARGLARHVKEWDSSVEDNRRAGARPPCKIYDN